ncbi:MAG: hypothetical protein RBU37_08320 [Myxococcota bacterium]|nr:hypothetical protein [Myxococcota bacterium]
MNQRDVVFLVTVVELLILWLMHHRLQLFKLRRVHRLLLVGAIANLVVEYALLLLLAVPVQEPWLRFTLLQTLAIPLELAAYRYFARLRWSRAAMVAIACNLVSLVPLLLLELHASS